MDGKKFRAFILRLASLEYNSGIGFWLNEKVNELYNWVEAIKADRKK